MFCVNIRSRFPITFIRIIFSKSLTTSRSNGSKQFSFMWWGFKLVELDIYVYCFSSLYANKDIKGPIMMSHMLTENSCPWVMRLCWARLDTAAHCAALVIDIWHCAAPCSALIGPTLCSLYIMLPPNRIPQFCHWYLMNTQYSELRISLLSTVLESRNLESRNVIQAVKQISN